MFPCGHAWNAVSLVRLTLPGSRSRPPVAASDRGLAMASAGGCVRSPGLDGARDGVRQWLLPVGAVVKARGLGTSSLVDVAWLLRRVSVLADARGLVVGSRPPVAPSDRLASTAHATASASGCSLSARSPARRRRLAAASGQRGGRRSRARDRVRRWLRPDDSVSRP